MDERLEHVGTASLQYVWFHVILLRLARCCVFRSCCISTTMPSKSPAQALLEKAEKKVNSSTGWFSSSSTKFEEAGDLYQQAANAFKLDKQFRDAGDAFAREAECRERCKEVNEAANAWWNAAKAYKRGYPDRKSFPFTSHMVQKLIPHFSVAVQALSQTITHLTASGRFRQAADREKEIAQIFQHELDNIQKACESLERAGDWYSQEDATALVILHVKRIHIDDLQYCECVLQGCCRSSCAARAISTSHSTIRAGRRPFTHVCAHEIRRKGILAQGMSLRTSYEGKYDAHT